MLGTCGGFWGDKSLKWKIRLYILWTPWGQGYVNYSNVKDGLDWILENKNWNSKSLFACVSLWHRFYDF